MQILFYRKFQFKKPGSTGMHSHPFWQLDYYYESAKEVIVELTGETITLDETKAIIIPPNTLHNIKNPGNNRINALKFQPEDPIFKNFKTCTVKIADYPTVWSGLFESYPISSETESRIMESYLFILLLKLKMEQCDPENDSVVRDQRIQNAVNFIKNNPQKKITLDELSRQANLSINHLVRKFKKETDQTPIEYVRKLKIHKAVELLKFSDLNIAQIADILNYPDQHTFSRTFKKEAGLSPANFRIKHTQD